MPKKLPPELDVDVPSVDELPSLDPAAAAVTKLLTRGVRKALRREAVSGAQMVEILTGLLAAVGLEAGRSPGELGDHVQAAAGYLVQMDAARSRR